jgi:hypothetical protein
MTLVPTEPPGRATRKARAFATDIVQLRSQGYTLEAIRHALQAAGVHVSSSTVWREANRTVPHPKARPTSPGMPEIPATLPQPAATPAVAAMAPAVSLRGDRRSGKEIAEEFMRTQITNPLIRAKEPR